MAVNGGGRLTCGFCKATKVDRAHVQACADRRYGSLGRRLVDKQPERPERTEPTRVSYRNTKCPTCGKRAATPSHRKKCLEGKISTGDSIRQVNGSRDRKVKRCPYCKKRNASADHIAGCKNSIFNQPTIIEGPKGRRGGRM